MHHEPHAGKTLRRKSHLRYGIHTILWGKAPDRLTEILDFINMAKFSGVEFFQHTDYLRSQFPNPADFRNTLANLGLTIIGFCSGSLSERVQFCLDYQIHPEYLYVDAFDEDITEATKHGIRVAFHPHAYKQHDPASILGIIEKTDGLKLLIDPAHLTVMNRDAVEWLTRASNLMDSDGTSKLIAVHLKDWGGWYGRSFQRYAQGFVELGAGEVRLEEFFRLLLGVPTPKWAIVEQDHMTARADSCISQSIRWINHQLAQNGFADSELQPVQANHSMVASGLGMPVDLSPAGERVLNGILKSQESIEVFAQFVTDLFQDWLGCPLVSLWEHTPAIHGGRMTVLGSCPRGIPVGPMRATESLPGYVVQSKKPWFEPRMLHVKNRPFSRPDVASEYQLCSLYSLPILNSHNPNDVQAVLNLYFSTDSMQNCLPPSEIAHFNGQSLTVPEYIDRIMTQAAEYIAIALERILADRVLKAVSEVRTLSGRASTRAEFLKAVLEIACKAVRAEAATLFIEGSNKRLREAACTSELLWRMQKPYYGSGEGQVGRCWENDMEFVDDTPPSNRTFSEERLASTNSTASRAYVPLRDFDRCIGVLRCRNKTHPSEQRYFTQSDITVLQAICDAMIPRLKLYSAEERNIVMFRKMAHELKTPLTGVNSQLDFIERESGRVNFSGSSGHLVAV